MKNRKILLVPFLLLFISSGGIAKDIALSQLSDSFESLAERVSPSVVQIFSTGYSSGATPATATGGGLLTNQRSSGSGVILDPDGYIVTNAHVVAGALRLQVLLAGSSIRGAPGSSILKLKGKVVPATVVGIDEETDLAVLKVSSGKLPSMELGNSDTLRPGQIVLAFGSPLGLENSVTMGVVSAVARQLRPEDPMIYIQTDAPINPGNSGGPLVDTEGQVVGINTSIFSQSGGSEGIGFAAPSNIVRNVFAQIRKTGHVRRGEIGVFAQTITPSLAAGLGLSQNWGVILGDVFPKSPAERAGLRAGDIILSIDGKPVENGRQFDVNLYRRSEEDNVTLEIVRGQEKLMIPVSVIVREDEPNYFSGKITPDGNLIPKVGIFVIELDDEIAAKIPSLRKQYGVVIVGRTADAPYWAGQFQPGDVIHAVNGTLITGLSQFRSRINEVKSADSIVLQIERAGKLFYVSFELQ